MISSVPEYALIARLALSTSYENIERCFCAFVIDSSILLMKVLIFCPQLSLRAEYQNLHQQYAFINYKSTQASFNIS